MTSKPKPPTEDQDVNVIINSGIAIIAKEVRRLGNLKNLTTEDANLLTDYIKCLSVINKDSQREEKKVKMDLSSLDGDALDKFIAENGEAEDE